VLLIAAIGTRSSGGFSVEMDVQAAGDGLIVSVQEEQPGPHSVVTAALTYPYTAVVVDGRPASVTFRLLPPVVRDPG
jgi:hypothetical protein